MAGGLLHRIVEDYLTENKENTGKKRRKWTLDIFYELVIV